MTAPIITLFNNKGGVGKTTLIFHLAWMFSALGKRVVVADLDPQSNLTSMFLGENELEDLWSNKSPGCTIFECVKPLAAVQDVIEPVLKRISSGLYLIPGDVALFSFEDVLSSEWSASMGDDNLYRPMRILSSFWNVMKMAADKVDADIIFVDIGPSLGAINRSVLISTDYVITPLSADLFSLQGIKNIGPILKKWKSSWQKRIENWECHSQSNCDRTEYFPEGKMVPVGYLVQQYGMRFDRPVAVYEQWVKRFPSMYRELILELGGDLVSSDQSDPFCLGVIRNYRSLIAISQEKRKPVFRLTPADGAIGSHAGAVQDAKKNFETLAYKIADKIGLDMF